MDVAVIGLGKLGLPLAALLASSGNRVKGYDLLGSVRESIRDRSFNSQEPGLESLLNQDISLEIVDDIGATVKDVEIVFIIVPTPSLESGHFSNQHLLSAVTEVAKSIEKSQRIVVDIVSTVMPGSCEGPIKEALESGSGRKIGSSLGLCYNPEFIALGSVIKDMQYPDMHLIGESSHWAGAVVEQALKSIVKINPPVRKMKLKEAELVKIAVNNYVTMKISYANSLMQGSVRLGGVDIDVVTDAIGLDSRIGNKYLKAAAPYGGPCFPRDTRALNALYKDLGLSDSLSQATEEINGAHADFVADLVTGRVETGAKIGIVGLSYKVGTSVVEDSPGLAIANSIKSRGFQVIFWDDEGAEIEIESPDSLTKDASHFISLADFIVITRNLKDPVLFTNLLKISEKPYFDLWREIKY